MQKGFLLISILIATGIIILIIGGRYYLQSIETFRYFGKQEIKNILPDNQVCIQVITPAKNLQTGECKDFPTPCDVPAGWEKIESC